MISTTDFKTGMAIIFDGQLCSIVEFQHVKPGKGGAFVRTKLRRMKDGAIFERNFRAAEKFEDAFIEKRTLQFLYQSGSTYHLMDTKTYEEFEIPSETIGEAAGYLKENMELEASYCDGELLSVEPPMFVDVEIAETEPGIKGDSSRAGMKPATLETGATIRVPLFVDKGDMIRVDTRTGSYVSRI